MMKTTFAALLATFSTIASGQLKDVDGWQSAKWGMSQSAVTEAYHGQVKSRPTGFKQYPLPFLDLQEPMVIADTPFLVTFRFDAESKGLDCVSLSPRNLNATPEVLVQELLRLLTEKYGAPTEKAEKLDHGNDDRKYTWLYPSTVIELNFFSSHVLKGLETLYVSYRKRDVLKNPL
jgi:hypothetical protein